MGGEDVDANSEDGKLALLYGEPNLPPRSIRNRQMQFLTKYPSWASGRRPPVLFLEVTQPSQHPSNCYMSNPIYPLPPESIRKASRVPCPVCTSECPGSQGRGKSI